jgi:hypothetical protein
MPELLRCGNPTKSGGQHAGGEQAGRAEPLLGDLGVSVAEGVAVQTLILGDQRSDVPRVGRSVPEQAEHFQVGPAEQGAPVAGAHRLAFPAGVAHEPGTVCGLVHWRRAVLERVPEEMRPGRGVGGGRPRG